MKENYWQSLIGHIDAGVKQKEQQNRKSQAQLEKVRRTLESKAREVISRYVRTCQELRPEAQQKLEQVVVPWWDGEIVGSGFAEHLAAWLKQMGAKTLIITEPYWVFWPKRLQEEMGVQGEKPFSFNADLVLTDELELDEHLSFRERLEKELTEMDSSQEPADVQLRGLANTVSLEFYFGRGFRGCGFNPDRYAKPFPIKGAETRLPPVNPSVIIDFASQIENGKVRAVIEKAIKSVPKTRNH